MGLKNEDIVKFIYQKNNKFTKEEITQIERDLKKQGYEPIQILGAGQSGVAIQCKDKMNQDVAIKIVKIKSQEERQQVLKEIEVMQKINSKFVLKCIQGYDNQSEKQLFIVMPLYKKGNLEEFIKNNPSLPNSVLAKKFKAILFGIIDMHANNILHNDLKLENILLSDDFSPVIGDLGLSRQINTDKGYLRDVGGAIVYQAPESMCGKAVKQSDYFSAGMILFAMCCNNNLQKMNDYRFGSNPNKVEVGEERQELIVIAKSMMRQEYEQRPNPKEVIKQLENIKSLQDLDLSCASSVKYELEFNKKQTNLNNFQQIKAEDLGSLNQNRRENFLNIQKGKFKNVEIKSHIINNQYQHLPKSTNQFQIIPELEQQDDIKIYPQQSIILNHNEELNYYPSPLLNNNEGSLDETSILSNKEVHFLPYDPHPQDIFTKQYIPPQHTEAFVQYVKRQQEAPLYYEYFQGEEENNIILTPPVKKQYQKSPPIQSENHLIAQVQGQQKSKELKQTNQNQIMQQDKNNSTDLFQQEDIASYQNKMNSQSNNQYNDQVDLHTERCGVEGMCEDCSWRLTSFVIVGLDFYQLGQADYIAITSPLHLDLDAIKIIIITDLCIFVFRKFLQMMTTERIAIYFQLKADIFFIIFNFLRFKYEIDHICFFFLASLVTLVPLMFDFIYFYLSICK